MTPGQAIGCHDGHDRMITIIVTVHDLPYRGELGHDQRLTVKRQARARLVLEHS
jgi:hypothetical protein